MTIESTFNSKISQVTKDINLPDRNDEDLAYFLGLLVGDGYVKYYAPKKDYQIFIDGNKEEYEWYCNFIRPLVIKLFNKIPTIRITRTTVQLSLHSKAIFLFLTETCGLPSSPKKNTGIPQAIWSCPIKDKCAFLRGLADTDCSLTFKKEGRYPVVDFCTSSEKLLNDFLELTNSLGIKGTHGVYHTLRNGTKTTRYYWQLNGVKNLEKWMTLIGFCSPTQLTKYAVWKEKGKMKSGTSLNERMQMFKRKENPAKFP